MHHYEQDVPFEVPKGWVWTTLEEITSKIGSGSTPKGSNYSEEGIPFFRSQNVYNEGLVYEDIRFISDATHQLMIGTEVHSKDLLLNITGGSLGRCAIVPADFQIGNVSQHVCIIRSILVLSSYVHTFILSPFFKKTMNITGSGREGLPKYNLEKMFLPIPPLKEQERIIKEIEHWFTFIDTIEQSKVNLQTAIKQTKSKILDLAIHGKLVPQDPSDEPASELLKRINPKAQITCDNEHSRKLPKGWYNTTLANMCNTTNGLWKGKKPPFVKVGVIRNANFTKYFTLDYSKIEYIDVEQRAFEKKHLLHGDLIVEKSGGSDKNPVGRAIFFDGEDGLFSFSNFTMCLRCKDQTTLMSKYLFYLLLCIYSRGDMVAMQTQTTGLHNLLVEKFMAMTFPLPPFAEQKRIVQKIEELFSLLDCIEKALQA